MNLDFKGKCEMVQLHFDEKGEVFSGTPVAQFENWTKEQVIDLLEGLFEDTEFYVEQETDSGLKLKSQQGEVFVIYKVGEQ